MAQFEGCILDVKANHNTISVVATFNTQEEISLKADNVDVHPLVFNPIDGLHYSMIWIPEGFTIHRLEAIGFADTEDELKIVEDGPWTTLTTPVARPVRAQQLVVSPTGSGSEFSQLNPGNLQDAVQRAVQTGNTEILMKEGIYKPSVGGDTYMAEFQNGGNPFEKVSIIAEYPLQTTISNLLDDSGFSYLPIASTTGLYVVEGAPQQIDQLHGVLGQIFGLSEVAEIERLQEGATIEQPWTQETLDASPLGGWYHNCENQLVVKLPDGSHPQHKLRVSNTDHQKAWLFQNGTDLWLEGIVFEYWLQSDSGALNERGSSVTFELCEQVMVRGCHSRYTMDYSLTFSNCQNYIVEGCRFVDGQTYTSYLHIRHGPQFAGSEENRPRFSGCIRNLDSSLGSIRNNIWIGCFVANQFFSHAEKKTECIEFHHNYVIQARNHPIMVKEYGGRHAIWANKFSLCGQIMPNNDGKSPISPVYWINNLAVEAGYFGTTYKPDDAATQTARAIKGNRFGGAPTSPIGQYFFYYNTLRVEWYPDEEGAADQIEHINAWESQRGNHSASRYYNNIFTSTFRDVKNSETLGNHIWHMTGELDVIEENLNNMHWDCNQYHWDKGDQLFSFNVASNSNADFDFNEMREFTTVSPNVLGLEISRVFEPSGAYLNPEFDSVSHPTNTIPAKFIPGVTGNTVLRNPGTASGANT